MKNGFIPKKLACLTLIAAILCASTVSYAGYTDVPATAVYCNSVERVVKLGIMDEASKGRFKPDSPVTRMQFVQIIVTAAGLEEQAYIKKGPTVFSDIGSGEEYTGYVNVAVEKGFITGMPDGGFHPDEPVTFAQACTALIKVLGYASQDIPGLWPRNYIEKAKALNITKDLSFGSGDEVPRWAMAVMVDRLLDTCVKKSSPGEQDKTLAASAGFTFESIYSVYGKAEVALDFEPSSRKLGSIDFRGSPSIIKNGETISITQIEEKDVVYEVTDKWGKNRYILVMDDKVEGEITGILPNKLYPEKLEIDGKAYSLGRDMDLNKVNTAAGSFNTGDKVTALLGYDGKIVDVFYYESEDNAMYAVVLNCTHTKSRSEENFGEDVYTVKLLVADGSTVTYNTASDPSEMKGKLVTYSKIDNGTVALEALEYAAPKDYFIRSDTRRLDNNYITDNIKIFNIISNYEGKDAEAELLDWTELPYGSVPSSKVLYLNKVGAFEDVNVLLLSDFFDEKHRLACVKNLNIKSLSGGNTTYNYTLLIGDREYAFDGVPYFSGAVKGSVVKALLSDGKISSCEVMAPEVQGTLVQAVDAERIRIDNNVYRFKENISVYLINDAGEIKSTGVYDIEAGKLYGKVSVYLDKPYAGSGRAEAIVIRE